MKLSELKIKDIDYYIIKDGEFECCGFLWQEKKNKLSFINSKKFIRDINEKNTSSIICTEDLVSEVKKIFNGGIIKCSDPRSLIMLINNSMSLEMKKTIIGKGTRIDKSTRIAEFNVVIGEDCIIEEGVVIKEGVTIEDGVRIGPNSVIGGEGLMVYDIGGNTRIGRHKGQLIIKKYAEIQSSVIVEKGVFIGDNTIIGENTIIDSGAGISHGAQIGRKNIICSMVKICGYTSLGEKVYVGPSVLISNNLTIGDNCKIRLGSVVIRSMENFDDVSGPFAVNHKINMSSRKKLLKEFSDSRVK